MSTIKLRGVVLKEKSVKESDKIVTILAKDRGIVNFYARGAKKTKSRFLAPTQLFTYGDFVLYEGDSFYSLTQAEVLNSFYNIRNDYDAFQCGNYFLSLTISVCQQDLPANDTLLLLITALSGLSKDTPNVKQIRSVFDFRFLVCNGLMPHFEHCVVCGSQTSKMFFDVDKNGVCCIEHKTTAEIPPVVLETILYIIQSPLKQAFSFYATEQVLDYVLYYSKSLMMSAFHDNVPMGLFKSKA